MKKIKNLEDLITAYTRCFNAVHTSAEAIFNQLVACEALIDYCTTKFEEGDTRLNWEQFVMNYRELKVVIHAGYSFIGGWEERRTGGGVHSEFVNINSILGLSNDLEESWEPDNIFTGLTFTAEPCDACKSLDRKNWTPEMFFPNEIVEDVEKEHERFYDLLHNFTATVHNVTGGCNYFIGLAEEYLTDKKITSEERIACQYWLAVTRKAKNYIHMANECLYRTAYQQHKTHGIEKECGEAHFVNAYLNMSIPDYDFGVWKINKENLCPTCLSNIRATPITFKDLE